MARPLPRADRLTALILAATLTFAGTASIAARQAIPDECQQAGHPCGQLSLSDICCCGHQTSSTTLPTAPSERVRLTDSAITMQIVPGALVTVPDPATAAATLVRPEIPPHGFRFVELPILFASFLI